MFAHKLRVNQGFVQLNITASKDTNASIVNVLDGLSAVRTDFVASGMDDTSSQIWTAVKPNDVDVTAYLYAAMESSQLNASNVNIVTDKLFIGTNESSIAQAGTLTLRAGNMSTVNKYVGAASSDGFINPQETAKYASYDAMNTGFYQSMIDHITEWAQILPEDSVVSFLNMSLRNLCLNLVRIPTSIQMERCRTMNLSLNRQSLLFLTSTISCRIHLG